MLCRHRRRAPDFVVRFSGEQLAVEVKHMLDREGWMEERRVSFERKLEAVYRIVGNERGAPR